MRFAGSNAAVGGGVHWLLRPALALDVGVRYTLGSLSDVYV